MGYHGPPGSRPLSPPPPPPPPIRLGPYDPPPRYEQPREESEEGLESLWPLLLLFL